MQIGDSVESQVARGVATVFLNRPGVSNVLDEQTRASLQNVFSAIRREKDIRAVILTGNGNNFCVGSDIVAMEDMTEAAAREQLDDVARTVVAIASCNKPIVAAIEGHAAGSGIGLALLCDYIIASKQSRFSFSFNRVGLAPDWGLSITLPDRVGRSAARRLVWGASKLDASSALEAGLIDDVSLPGGAQEAALVEARTLADKATWSLKATQRFFSHPLDELSLALENETDAQTACLMSEDFVEGMNAIRLKRKPEFSA